MFVNVVVRHPDDGRIVVSKVLKTSASLRFLNDNWSLAERSVRRRILKDLPELDEGDFQWAVWWEGRNLLP